MRFRVAQSEATDRLVVVKIDAASLDQVGVWPWPRSLYADLLDRLFAAGAEDVALDIDFSSEIDPGGGCAPGRGLEPLRPARDPAGVQAARRTSDVNLVHQAGDVNFIYTEPLPQFREGTRLASLNITIDADGVVRQMPIVDQWQENVGYIVRLPVMLAGAGARASRLPSTSTTGSARTRSRSSRSRTCCTATSIQPSCAAITSSSAPPRSSWATSRRCRSSGRCRASSSRRSRPNSLLQGRDLQRASQAAGGAGHAADRLRGGIALPRLVLGRRAALHVGDHPRPRSGGDRRADAVCR